MKRLLDGQFDECGLTLQELATIDDSLIKSLTAVYHGRIKYPGSENGLTLLVRRVGIVRRRRGRIAGKPGPMASRQFPVALDEPRMIEIEILSPADPQRRRRRRGCRQAVEAILREACIDEAELEHRDRRRSDDSPA